MEAFSGLFVLLTPLLMGVLAVDAGFWLLDRVKRLTG
jgi:hypothetical protein